MNKTMIAIDPDALETLLQSVSLLHSRLDEVEMTPRSEWSTVPEYAASVGRTVQTVNKWIRDGVVETKREGTVRMVRRSV